MPRPRKELRPPEGPVKGKKRPVPLRVEVARTVKSLYVQFRRAYESHRDGKPSAFVPDPKFDGVDPKNPEEKRSGNVWEATADKLIAAKLAPARFLATLFGVYNIVPPNRLSGYVGLVVEQDSDEVRARNAGERRASLGFTLKAATALAAMRITGYMNHGDSKDDATFRFLCDTTVDHHPILAYLLAAGCDPKHRLCAGKARELFRGAAIAYVMDKEHFDVLLGPQLPAGFVESAVRLMGEV